MNIFDITPKLALNGKIALDIVNDNLQSYQKYLTDKNEFYEVP